MAEVTEPVPRIRALDHPAVGPPWGGSWHQLDPEIETMTAGAEITFNLSVPTVHAADQHASVEDLDDVIWAPTDEG